MSTLQRERVDMETAELLSETLFDQATGVAVECVVLPWMRDEPSAVAERFGLRVTHRLDETHARDLADLVLTQLHVLRGGKEEQTEDWNALLEQIAYAPIVPLRNSPVTLRTLAELVATAGGAASGAAVGAAAGDPGSAVLIVCGSLGAILINAVRVVVGEAAGGVGEAARPAARELAERWIRRRFGTTTPEQRQAISELTAAVHAQGREIAAQLQRVESLVSAEDRRRTALGTYANAVLSVIGDNATFQQTLDASRGEAYDEQLTRLVGEALAVAQSLATAAFATLGSSDAPQDVSRLAADAEKLTRVVEHLGDLVRRAQLGEILDPFVERWLARLRVAAAELRAARSA
jgi:hypothetical protein